MDRETDQEANPSGHGQCPNPPIPLPVAQPSKFLFHQGPARPAGRGAQRGGQAELRPVLPHRHPGQGRQQADHQGLQEWAAQ